MKTKEVKISKNRSREVKPTEAKITKVPMTLEEYLKLNPTLWSIAWDLMWRGFVILLFLYVSLVVFLAFLTSLFTNIAALVS